MLKYEEAKKKVLEYLNKEQTKEHFLLNEPGEEISYGWVFSYDLKGIFHPKVKEIEEKIKALKIKGNMEDRLEDILTREEIEILDNAVGLVGNAPIFIDKETAEIRMCQFPIEAIVQEIKESKTGQKYDWELRFKRQDYIRLEKIKQLHEMKKRFDTEIKITEMLFKVKHGQTFILTSNFREFIYWRNFLKFLEIGFDIIEKRNTKSEKLN